MENSFTNTFENFSRNFLNLAKITLPAIVIFSVIYEAAFFWGLGISINQTPLSASDFLRDWVEWSAYVIPVILIIIIFELTTRKIEGWQTEEQLIQSSSNPEKTRKLRESPYWLYIAIGFLGIFLFVLLGEAFLGIAQVGFLLCITFFLLWVFKGSPFNITKSIYRVMFISLWLSITFLIYGYKKGSDIATTEVNRSIGQVDLLENYPKMDVIRIYDHWTLVKFSLHEMGWLNHQSDRLIRFSVSKEKYKGLLCKKTSDYCSNFYKE
jgi:hypothetical protein